MKRFEGGWAISSIKPAGLVRGPWGRELGLEVTSCFENAGTGDRTTFPFWARVHFWLGTRLFRNHKRKVLDRNYLLLKRRMHRPL